MKITGLGLGSILLTFGIWHLSQGQSLTPSEDVETFFKGRILAASDADMISGAYANGVLNKIEGITDELALIDGNDLGGSIQNTIHSSNSVISWPAILEWNPKHRFAYIAETRGEHKEPSQKMNNVFTDFPVGQKISVINYQNPSSPKLVQEEKVGENIQGVSINHKGTLLVSGSTEKNKEFVIMKLDNGLIQNTYYFTHKDIDSKNTGNGGIRTIEFHPTKNIIAANLNNTHLLFFKVIETAQTIEIVQLGESLKVGKRWSVGNWHPNGNYFILSDLRWGDGLGQLTHGKGRLVSVRFRESEDHSIADVEKVGLSPEGFDISPNGNYAVTVNMRRTWAPKKGFWFVPARKRSSLSLVKIDSKTGELTKMGKDYGFEGALPEDAVFDWEGNSVAVAVYQDRNEEFPKEGWIDFWELKNDELINTGKQVKVTRGVHNLLLIE